MNRKMFLGLSIALIISFIGCGGGAKIQMPKEGIKLSYAPAVGKKFDYRTMVQKYIQSSHQGTSMSRLIKGDVHFTIDVVDAGEGGSATMKYKFTDVGVGVFVNSQIQSSDEVESMKDLELTVVLDTAGSIDSIDGIDLEEEYRKEEISPIDFLLSFPVPDEKVTVGYSWHKDKDTTITDEKGTVTQKTSVDYKVSNFVMLDGRRCVVCNVNGTVDITQKGESEQDGTTYDIDMAMNGEIKGTINFDVDNGAIVRYESNKMIDVTGNQINTDTGEKQPITYYNQETLDSRLQTK
ncbi:hypothetical protein J7L68_03920 [bacterium]|nr:hypothetical protein [bacterium]